MVGVLDLNSGGILALVSKPAFDPEVFSQEMGPEEWQAISNDPQKPLQNKFLQGIYSPGSVFKIIMALAGLQEKLITPATTVHCSGSQVFYDRVFHCWKPGGHGTVNLFTALENSCNIYFYNLGRKMDIDTIARYARLMGLGAPSGIDLPNENGGLVPGSAWKMNTFHQRWFPGETISVAIGHGSLNVTPAQMLKMIATVALRGRMPKLHLLQRIERRGKVVKEFAPGVLPRAHRRGEFRAGHRGPVPRGERRRDRPGGPHTRAGHLRQDGHGPDPRQGQSPLQDADPGEKIHAQFLVRLLRPQDKTRSWPWWSWWRTAATPGRSPRRWRPRSTKNILKMRDYFKYFDKLTFVLLLLLPVIGIFLIYSAGHSTQETYYLKQAAWLLFSILVFFVVFSLKIDFVFRKAFAVYAGAARSPGPADRRGRHGGQDQELVPPLGDRLPVLGIRQGPPGPLPGQDPDPVRK